MRYILLNISNDLDILIRSIIRREYIDIPVGYLLMVLSKILRSKDGSPPIKSI